MHSNEDSSSTQVHIPTTYSIFTCVFPVPVVDIVLTWSLFD